MSVFRLHDDPYLTPVAPVAAGAVHPCPHTSATEHASEKPLAELQHHGSVCRPDGGSNSDTMLLYDAGADIIHKRRGATVDLEQTIPTMAQTRNGGTELDRMDIVLGWCGTPAPIAFAERSWCYGHNERMWRTHCRLWGRTNSSATTTTMSPSVSSKDMDILRTRPLVFWAERVALHLEALRTATWQLNLSSVLNVAGHPDIQTSLIDPCLKRHSSSLSRPSSERCNRKPHKPQKTHFSKTQCRKVLMPSGASKHTGGHQQRRQ